MDVIIEVDEMAEGTSSLVSASVVRHCRSCHGANLQPFLSLGSTPIANALVTAEQLSEPDETFELGVAFCPDCSLVQLTHDLPAEVIFNSTYPYYSSFSDSFRSHARTHGRHLIETRGLGAGSRVVEIASNDGYLLQTFVEAGIPALGIEPSPGPAAAARRIGVETIEAFFDQQLARDLRASGPADVIVANNVMAHVPDLDGFVGGLRTLIADDGVITIENPYVRDLIDHCEFDTIYHEHFSYFSCTSVARLMRRHGLYLNDLEYFPELHGGSLRWYIAPREAPSARVLDYLAEEECSGITRFPYYEDFASRVQLVVADLVALVRKLKSRGATIAAYGAAAKGATLLNVAGLGSEALDFVADRNPHKQGKWMPGARLPIVDPAAITEQSPDYLLLLAWNHAREIMAQQDDFQRRGGRFIVPVPEPTIL